MYGGLLVIVRVMNGGYRPGLLPLWWIMFVCGSVMCVLLMKMMSSIFRLVFAYIGARCGCRFVSLRMNLRS